MVASSRPKVSVIVPMFNVEEFVGECLDSLLAQTLREIEIIAVDDGSPDKSGTIAEKYAAQDGRIRVIHQENGGLGPARNSGMKVARGDYIAFVDSDDWLHVDALKGMYDVAIQSRADVLVAGMEIWSDGKLADVEEHPLGDSILSGADQVKTYRKFLYGRLPGDSETRPYPVAACASLYKKELIDAEDIVFENVLSEDVFFNLRVLEFASVVATLKVCGYCYRKDCQASITRSFSQGTALRYQAFFRKLADCAESESDSNECMLRARRKMIDYSRSLTFAIEKSNLSHKEKTVSLKVFLSSQEFLMFCSDYPSKDLPCFQRLFQRMLVNRRVSAALALTRFRMMMRGES